MKTKLLGLIACMALLGIAPANALTFDFSFTNVSGNIDGTVTGEIDGLVNNEANQTPTAIFIDSAPAGLGLVFSTPFNLLADNFASYGYQFSVSDGTLTGLFEETDAATYLFQFYLLPGNVALINLWFPQYGNSVIGIAPPDFVAVTATPLPAALPLFATGLGAMGLFNWRRKRKNGPAVSA
jgi:hypothetical protein